MVSGTHGPIESGAIVYRHGAEGETSSALRLIDHDRAICASPEGCHASI
jgi:hypothetical protein